LQWHLPGAPTPSSQVHAHTHGREGGRLSNTIIPEGIPWAGFRQKLQRSLQKTPRIHSFHAFAVSSSALGGFCAVKTEVGLLYAPRVIFTRRNLICGERNCKFTNLTPGPRSKVLRVCPAFGLLADLVFKGVMSLQAIMSGPWGHNFGVFSDPHGRDGPEMGSVAQPEHSSRQPRVFMEWAFVGCQGGS